LISPKSAKNTGFVDYILVNRPENAVIFMQIAPTLRFTAPAISKQRPENIRALFGYLSLFYCFWISYGVMITGR
jgi:hypothetical protein